MIIELFSIELIFFVDKIPDEVASFSDFQDNFFDKPCVSVFVDNEWLRTYFDVIDELFVNFAVQSDLQIVGQG